MAIVVVADNRICRLKNIAGGTVVLLKLNNRSVGIGLIKVKNILNCCATEFINRLIVVANDHDIAIFVRKELCKNELRVVRVLILVYQNVSELILIKLTNLAVVCKKLNRLHNNVVKVNGIIFLHLLLIELIDGVDVTTSWIAGDVHLVGTLKLILGNTDCIRNRLWRKALLVNIQLLHTEGDHSLLIIGVVDGEALTVAKSVAKATKNTKANRVEGARPNGRSHSLVVKDTDKSVANLPCRLVGEGDGKYRPGRGRSIGELGKNLLNLIGLHFKRALKDLSRLGREAVRSVLREIGVAVFYKINYSVNQDGGFSATCPCQNKEGTLGSIYRTALLGVKSCRINLVEKRALGTKIFCFSFLHF